MPHLSNFLKDNGTLDTNDHTVLISHTGGGILSSLTGLYPDRHGQAVSNSYGYFAPGRLGRGLLVDRSSTGPTTPTAATRRTTRRRRPPTRTTTWSTTTRRRSAAPARCATRRRRGCRTRAPAATSATSGIANIVLENNNAIIIPTRRAHDARGARRRWGRRTSRSHSVNGLAAGADDRARDRDGEPRSRRSPPSAPPVRPAPGVTLDRAAHEGALDARGAGHGLRPTDPTGDMTKVFGAGSPEWNEGRDSQIAPGGHRRARTLAQTDFVGIAIHCAAGGGICNANAANARPDPLPDEAGGYSGLQGPVRREVRQPGDHARLGVRRRHDRDAGHPARSRPVRPVRLPGLRRDVREEHPRRASRRCRRPASRSPSRYISDAHDFHGVSGNDPRRLRAGRGRLRPAAQGLRPGVRRLLHPPEERRDHEGQHALRRHRRGRRPLRRHARPTRPATASRRPAPTRTATSPRSTATSGGSSRRTTPTTARARRRTSASTPTWRRTSTSRATRPATRPRRATSRRRCRT